MNKKSAIATAGALTASFVAGAAAVSFNWGLGSPSGASAAAATTAPSKVAKPIIKHRTVVIHRRSPALPTSSAPRTVVLPAPASTPAVTTTSGSHSGGGGEGDDSGEGGGD